MANSISTNLILNKEEQETFHRMNRRERLRFNALSDNISKLSFIQALVEREKFELFSSFPITTFSLGL
ncbi:hypothetical protein Glove_360g39 [Diversispora epigaea]|uniref:Uncharacterized protein n=1 Tax=Diversispora epigaea TaxID=1348612 RepID=A0A397HD49_9GLOM|nr:hypothetical protein Glove_360g39 [Diversispora epigaea]